MHKRGNTTKNKNLISAVHNAGIRFQKKMENKGTSNLVLHLDVQNHNTEPLLDIADYFCWSIQRIFERGEDRYYNFIKSKISLVVDLYDFDNYENSKNYYKSDKNPLTKANQL